MFLWRLLMADDIPTPAKGVYIYFDYIALGFVLVGVEELVRGKGHPWWLWVGCLVIGAVFLFVGVMGPKIKAKLSPLAARLRASDETGAALVKLTYDSTDPNCYQPDGNVYIQIVGDGDV